MKTLKISTLIKVHWGKLLTSKTLWVNLVAVVVAVVQLAQQEAWISAELQAGILGVLNLILRLVTNDAVIERK